MTATNNLAILLAKSGQLTAAENLWQKTFDLNQDIDELGINLALAESMLRNKNAAQRVLQRVLLYSRDQQNRSTKTSGDPIRPRNLRGSCFGILILDGISKLHTNVMATPSRVDVRQILASDLYYLA